MLRRRHETLQEQALREARAAGGIAREPLRLLTPRELRRQRLKRLLDPAFDLLVFWVAVAVFILVLIGLQSVWPT